MLRAMEPVYCEAHSARAGWTCTNCGRPLCPLCAWRRKAGSGTVAICSFCSELATPILIPRPMKSFGELLSHLVAYPFAGDAKAVLFGAFLILAALKLCWLPGIAMSSAILASYLFHVIHSSWKGRHEPPEFGDYSDVFDFVFAGFRAALAFGVALVPYSLYMLVAHRTVGLSVVEVARHASEPLGWAFLAIGLLWSPIAVLLATVNSPIGVMVNPFHAWDSVRRIGRDYYAAVGIFWFLVALWSALGGYAEWLVDRTGIYLLPEAVLELPRLYLALMAARVLGILLYAHGDDVGYGRQSDYLIHALGGVLPVDEAPAVFEEPVPQVVQPIELSDSEAPPNGFVPFEPWQPGADKGALELDEPSQPVRAPVVVPEAPRPAVVTEDLMPEDQFMETVFRQDRKDQGP